MREIQPINLSVRPELVEGREFDRMCQRASTSLSTNVDCCWGDGQ